MGARITSFSNDGLTFDVIDEGPVDGEVVVLLHGFPQLNTEWSAVTPLLHAEGYRTLAPNQRGYAVGARPRGRRPYRVTHLVADVAALVEAVGGPVHLVGHDWGAAVGWAAVSRRPELFRSYVAVSVPHPGAFLRAMPRGQALKSWYMAAFNVPAVPERLLTSKRLGARFLGDYAGMTPGMLRQFDADFGADRDRLRGGLGWYRALPLEDPRTMFGKAQVPSTLIWGEHDVALGRAGTELCAEYVDADFGLEVVDGGHWLPEEMPDEVARIILERISAS